MNNRLLDPLAVSRCLKVGMNEAEQIDAILIAQASLTLKEVGDYLDKGCGSHWKVLALLDASLRGEMPSDG